MILSGIFSFRTFAQTLSYNHQRTVNALSLKSDLSFFACTTFVCVPALPSFTILRFDYVVLLLKDRRSGGCPDFSMVINEVKVDKDFVPALEDETIEVQNLLAEPKTDNVSVDSVLCFSKNSWKLSGIEDYGLEFGLKRNYDGFGGGARGHDDLEFGVLDGLLDDVEEVDDIHAANDISGACEDFLLDIELAEKTTDLECTPCFDRQSSGFCGSSNGSLGLPGSSTPTIPEFEHKNCSLKTVKCELDDSSRNRWDSQALAEDNVFPTSQDLDPDGLDDVKPLTSGGIMFNGKTKKSFQETKGCTPGQKRLCKPTKRFVAVSKDKRPKNRSHNELHHVGVCTKESASGTTSCATPEDVEKLPCLKHIIKRKRIPSATSRDKHLKLKFQDELHVGAMNLTPKQESCTGTSTQAPFESRPPRRRAKKCVPLSFLESDDEHSESEDDHLRRRTPKRSADRRKHQRMWTPSEVLKLVDGIAEYGTGRWTDIKKVMFASSAYRTPVDLRDKWRNLLRASCVVKRKYKKEVEQKRKHAVRPLPKSVLHQIRELASIHPYPRFSPGGRYICRKKN